VTADDGGAGVLSAAIGMGVFLAFLFFAMQVMFGLYATSTLRGTLSDAAARAASGELGPAQIAAVEDEARTSLGAMGRRPTTVIDLRVVDEDGDGRGDVVAGHAAAVPPRFMPPAVGGALGFDRITADVRVRVERPR
jgi:hypothetical protein